jgi:hypothetical protein
MDYLYKWRKQNPILKNNLTVLYNHAFLKFEWIHKMLIILHSSNEKSKVSNIKLHKAYESQKDDYSEFDL